MKLTGTTKPWTVAHIEVTTFDLERIADALTYVIDGKPPVPDDVTFKRIRADIRDVLKRTKL